MNSSSNIRLLARNALAGKWGIAVLAGFIAALLGAVSSGGPDVKFDLQSYTLQLKVANITVYSSADPFYTRFASSLGIGLFSLAVIAMAIVIVLFVLGSVVGVGYSRFGLDMVDRRNPAIGTMFSYFPHCGTIVIANILKTLIIFGLSLLLVVPGIIAAYSYAMTDYILAEHPEMPAKEVLRLSKEMMRGNRWRLFCLQLSFIGWAILCAFTFGIGNLWLTPYVQTATAVFYRDITGTWPAFTDAEPAATGGAV